MGFLEQESSSLVASAADVHRAGLTCEQGFLNLMIIQTRGYFRKQSEKSCSEITNTY